MLENLTGHNGSVSAVRLVAPEKEYVAVLKEMGVSEDDLDESLAYFGDLDATPASGLDWIFDRRGQRGRPQSRFTDGSVPVYYSALDQATAEAETAYGLDQPAGATCYFRALAVDFRGAYVDLGELEVQAAFLTGEQNDGAYDECLLVTREALERGHDGFMTPSARRPEGKCFPILSRDAIRSLAATGYVRFDYDNARGRWTCKIV